MCSSARVALWCSQQGDSILGDSRACGEPEHVFAGMGEETITPSVGGKKAPVHNGIQTTIVGPKLVGDVILSFHPWLLDGPICRGTYMFDMVAMR